MRDNYLKILLILVLINLSPLATSSTSSALKKKQSNLYKINKKINRVESNIVKTKRSKKKLYRSLKKTELAINAGQQSLFKLNRERIHTAKRLKQLKTKSTQLNKTLTLQQQQLSKQILASYLLGRHRYLKLLLNQKPPHTIRRLLTYYQYLNNWRVKTISSIKPTLKAMLENRKKMEMTVNQLTSLTQKKQSAQKKLEKNRLVQRRTLNSLGIRLKHRQRELKQLKANQAQVENIIKQLKGALSSLKTKIAFSRQRHRLPWPLKGHVITTFGKRIAGSRMRANGIFIRASEGTRVRAVANGKIVFANWLRGFGLLVIVAHGKGYMTLYAHNQALYKKVGSVVQAGDIIASAGHSGGHWKNGLYFEIRRNGNPVNPLTWLKSRAT